MGRTSENRRSHIQMERLDPIEAAELNVSDEERIKRAQIMNRRTGQELRDKWQQGDRVAIAKALQDMAPPMIVEKRCKVCTAPIERRDWIEQMVTKGYGYKAIAESWKDEDGEPIIGRHSIKNHYEKHMTIEDKAIRATLDEEAARLQQNAEDAAQGAISDRGMLKVLIRKAYDEARAGIITMEIRDMISALKLLNDIEVKEAGSKAEKTENEMRIFTQAVMVILDESQRIELQLEIARLRADQKIEEEIESKFLLPPGDDDVQIADGEVVG